MSVPQAMRPSGLMGRPFGWIMERLNRPLYHRVLANLDAVPAAALLEIGFGTGGFLELYCKERGPKCVSGMDPSKLMLDQTQKRLRLFPEVNSRLFLGDDGIINQVDGPFDHVVALHSYQFWQNPEATFLQISGLMKPEGTLCLSLRRHRDPPPEWLVNPISRGRQEIDDTLDLLKYTGFASASIIEQNQHSVIVVAQL